MGNQSTARLLASSLHEMRNILAVINESSGLSQDVATAMAQNSANVGKDADTILASLQNAQEAITNANKLVGSMEYMAQMCNIHDGADLSCNLDRACQGFCCMARRWAKSVCIDLTSGDAQEQVWSNLPVPLLHGALLEILDLCASVGGQVSLHLTAGHWSGAEGIFIVLSGDNFPLALTAMMGKKNLDISDGNYLVALASTDGSGVASRFFLSFQGA